MDRELARVVLGGMVGVFAVASCTLSTPEHPAAGSGAAGVGGNTAGTSVGGSPGGAEGNDTAGGRAAGTGGVGPGPGGSGAGAPNLGGTTSACDRRNACGGCVELLAMPGAACGECGKYECSSDQESVACVDPKLNACGGCGALANPPNSSCGSCGNWQCTADKSDVRCSGVNTNECGGCGVLAQPPGGSCGACGKYECSPDKTKTICNDPGLNDCGGCAVLTNTLRASCGACSIYECAANKNALICKAQCQAGQVCVPDLDQCRTPDCTAADSCGNSDGAGSLCTGAAGNCEAKPNATGSCVGASCTYVCNGAKLSCSTASRPACATWDFESNGVEGWSLSNRLDSANSGGLYVTASPGAGAGALSLALNIDSSSAEKNVVEIETNLCGNANATGIQGAFHVSVWFKPSDGQGAAAGIAYAYPFRSGGSAVGGVDSSVPAGQWFDVSSNAIAGEDEGGIVVHVGGLANRKGVLYFDKMRFQ